MDQMEKTASVLKKTLSVLRVIIIVLAVIVVVAAVTLSIVADRVTTALQDGTASATVNIGGMAWQFSHLSATTGGLRGLLIAAMLVALVVVALTLAGIYLLEAILGDTAKGQPFSADQPRRIRRLAILVFVGSVLVPALAPVVELYVYRFLNISVVTSSNPQGLTLTPAYSYTIDVVGVLVGFALLLLAYVFEYGNQLQKQSDETL